MSESKSCPSCGRDRDEASGSIRLMTIAKKSAEKDGKPLTPKEAQKAREGVASKDAHAVIPQTVLRPSAQMLFLDFLIQNGVGPGDKPEVAKNKFKETGKEKELKDFYKSHMTAVMMRPLAPQHHKEFEDAKGKADLKVEGVDASLMAGLEKLLVEKGLDACEGETKGGDLEAPFSKVKANRIVQNARPQSVSVAEVQKSREKIATSAKVTDGETASVEQPCHDVPSTENSPSVTSDETSQKPTVSASVQPEGFKIGSEAQKDTLGQVLRNARNSEHKSETVFGNVVKAIYMNNEEPPGEVTQYVANDGTVLACDKKITKSGAQQSLMSHDDLKNLEIHLRKCNNVANVASKLFQGIMGAPFTAGTQCGYCEAVQGEFTLPERVRLARDNKLVGPLRKAFVSDDLEAKIIAKAGLTGKVTTLDEIVDGKEFEQALQGYMEAWLDPVADELIRRLPELFGERVVNSEKDEAALNKLYDLLSNAVAALREALPEETETKPSKEEANEQEARSALKEEADLLTGKASTLLEKESTNTKLKKLHDTVLQKKKAVEGKEGSMRPQTTTTNEDK